MVVASAASAVAAACVSAPVAGSAVDAFVPVAGFGLRLRCFGPRVDVPGPASVAVSGVPGSAFGPASLAAVGIFDRVKHFPSWEPRLARVPADLWRGQQVVAEHCSPAELHFPAVQRFPAELHLPDAARFPADQRIRYELPASRRVQLVDGTALRLL